MLNQLNTSKNRSISKFLGQRRKSLSAKKQPKENFQGLQFVRDNQGAVTVNRLETGAYKAVFASKTTGRKAFAYGITFHGAYQNMIRLFNIKYATHG